MIYQYNKELGDFWEDYEMIDYYQFVANLHLLGGRVEELINGRRYLIGENSKAPKEFKKWAFRNCMTPEIEAYRKKSQGEIHTRNAKARIATIDGQAQANRERRLKEKKRKDFKSWR